MLDELLFTLLQTIIITVVPLLTAYLVKWLNAKASQVMLRIENEKTKALIAETTAAVSAAVSYTSQTYVDALRKTGVFTLDNQHEAFALAKNTALSLLSASTIDFLNRVYGNADSYLETKIEQEVKIQKSTFYHNATLAQHT